MLSRFTFTPRRRIVWSYLISGGAHVVAVGGALMAARFGWLPQPFPTQTNQSSIRLLASMIPAEAAQTQVSTIVPLAAEALIESEELPRQLKALTPVENARVTTRQQQPLPRRLPKDLAGHEVLAAAALDGVIARPPATPRKTASDAERVSALAALSEPQPRSGDTAAVTPDKISAAQAKPIQAESLDSREKRGAEFERLPTAVFNPAPVYPAAALAERREGRVVLRALIDKTGRVARVAVLRSCGDDELDRAALQAVRQWQFSPGQRLGQNAAGEVAIPIVFQIAK